MQTQSLRLRKNKKHHLKSFAGEIIKGSKEGTTTIEGSIKTLIEGINNGNVLNQDAIKALIEIQKTGNPEQKDAATKTLEELKKDKSKHT